MKVSACERYEGSQYWVHVDRINDEIEAIFMLGGYPPISGYKEGMNEFTVEGITVKWNFAKHRSKWSMQVDYGILLLDIYVGSLLVYVYKGCLADSEVLPGAWWSAIVKIPAYLAGLRAVRLREIEDAKKAKEQSEEAERLRVEAEWLKSRGGAK